MVATAIVMLIGGHIAATVAVVVETPPSISEISPRDGESVTSTSVMFKCLVSGLGTDQPDVELWVDDSGPGAAVNKGINRSCNPEWQVTDLPLGACDFYFKVTSVTPALTSLTHTVTVVAPTP